MAAIIRYPYKLIWFERYPAELYDISKDPREATDLAAARPDLVMAMGRDVSRLQARSLERERQIVELSPEERAGLRYLLVTFDPAVDTPERLAAYAREHGLAGDRWTLARGTPDQVRELAAVLGVKYRSTGDGQYSHTQRITLLDRDGVVIEKFDGLDRPLGPIVARTKQGLAREK